MSDTFDLLMANESDDDDAVDREATAADEEAFDPLAVLDDLDTPEDDESDDAEGDESEPEVDYRALAQERADQLAQVQQERDTARDEAERKEQMRLMRDSKAAWDAEESQAVDWAKKQPNANVAIDALRTYYNNKLQQVTTSAQTVIAQAYSGQYIDQIAAQTGLSDEDKALVATLDPKVAGKVAAALAAKEKRSNERLAGIENELKQLKRGRQADRRGLTGQDRPSNSRPPGGPLRNIKYGSEDNAMFLLDATHALKQRSG